MIKVSIIKEDKKYKKISILGHALYDDYGKDIVCSACSSIVTKKKRQGRKYLIIKKKKK